MRRFSKPALVLLALISIQPAFADRDDTSDNDRNYVTLREAKPAFDPAEYDAAFMPKAVRAEYEQQQQQRRERAKEQLAKINTGATGSYGPFVFSNR